MIILVAFALIIITITCLLVSLRMLGLLVPLKQMTAPQMNEHYHHIRFEMDESRNGNIKRALIILEQHGYSLVSECHLGWDKTVIVTMKKRMIGNYLEKIKD